MPPIQNSKHYQKPIDKGMITPIENDLIKVAEFDPTIGDEMFQKGFEMGSFSKRAEIITMVIALLKENPNLDGLEILKKL